MQIVLHRAGWNTDAIQNVADCGHRIVRHVGDQRPKPPYAAHFGVEVIAHGSPPRGKRA